MKVKLKDRRHLILSAQGKEKNDLKIINCKVLNVFTGKIEQEDIYITDGFISYVGKEELDTKEIYDAKGAFVIPGLIDSHVHIESSMLHPANFAKVVLPWGTTTIINDPHEIGNVLGVDGVRYMIKKGEGIPMRQLFDIPSCVPSLKGKENAGATFYSKEIKELSKEERVIGLAEVMDYVSLLNGDQWILDILDTAEEEGLMIQGHAPSLTGKELSAYLCAGPNTDHETRDTSEASDKLKRGMRIDIRESSIAKNVKEIFEGVKDSRYYDQLSFCTDDREADDILKNGHLNVVLNKAIASGMDPIDAIKCATYNAAKEAHLENIGAVASGYTADLILLDDLSKIDPKAVFFMGELVAENGRLCVDIEDRALEEEGINTIKINDISIDDLTLKAKVKDGSVLCNVMSYENENGSLSSLKQIELEVEDHIVKLRDDFKFVAVINRYGTGDICLGVVENFGSKRGALASTVSHDCHNLTVVFDDPVNALICVKEIQRVGGGMCAVLDNRVLYTLALPLAGLMSLKGAEELSKDIEAMKDADRELGLTSLENPLLRIVTLALPVIPFVKFSDLGMIDVLKKEFIPVLLED